MIFLFVFVLLLSFYLLAKICDNYFVKALDKIAIDLKMSEDVAGATLMAIGSSAPELFVAIIALVKPGGHESIGMGTIVGSALFNVLMIVGASAIIMKDAVLRWKPVVRDVFFYSISIGVLLWAFWDGKIQLAESGVFVGIYVIYLIVLMNWKRFSQDKGQNVEGEAEEEQKISSYKIFRVIDAFLDKLFPSEKHYYWIFGISIFLIASLSYVLVESAIYISHVLHIPEAIVALTILAAGTSIPDLLSSIIVAKKRRGDMAISNAIGSNIFDVLVGLGVPWLVMLAWKGNEVEVSTENLSSSVILLFATVMVIFVLLIARQWKIGYKAGYFLIGLYVSYVLWAISQVI